MQKYQVTIPPKFWASAKRLKTQYEDEYPQIIEDIKESIHILAEESELPESYGDHILAHSPYVDFNEYHVREDVLVVYFRNDRRLTMRFIEITDHKHLKNNDTF